MCYRILAAKMKAGMSEFYAGDHSNMREWTCFMLSKMTIILPNIAIGSIHQFSEPGHHSPMALPMKYEYMQ